MKFVSFIKKSFIFKIILFLNVVSVTCIPNLNFLHLEKNLKMQEMKHEFIKQNIDFSTADNNNLVEVVFKDKENQLWIGTKQTGLWWKSNINNKFQEYQDGILASSEIKVIFEDKNNNMWVSSQSGFYEKTSTSSVFTEYSNKNIKNVNCIVQDMAGYIWIGDDSGLWVSRDNGETFTNEPKGLMNVAVKTLYIDKNQGIWAAEQKFLYYKPLGNENFLKVTSFPDNTSGVTCIAQSFKSSDLWVGSLYGLYRYDLKNNQFYSYALKDARYSISSIYIDIDDNVWVSSRESNLGIWEKTWKSDEFIQFTNFGNHPSERYFSFCKDDDDYLWLGGNNSLYVSNFKTYDRVKPDLKQSLTWVIIIAVVVSIFIIICVLLLWYFWNKDKTKIYNRKIENED